MKVMIVEDHGEMRRMLKNIVSLSFPEGVEIIDCASAEEAIDQFGRHNPDCVLMDFQLNQMNGFDAIKQIYKLHPGANVIMVTSFDSASIRKKAEKLRVKGFVSKENLFEIPQILQMINKR